MSFGNDDAVRTRTVRATDDRAEIMRILNAVANNDQGLFIFFCRKKLFMVINGRTKVK
jgi:hypothetical protein